MDAKKTWDITERMIQGQFTADEDMLKKYSKNGIRLEWAPDKKYIKVYVNGKYDGAIFNSNKTIRIGGEPVNTSVFFKDAKDADIGNWVEGEMDGCKYQAKVFEEGSMYGIKGGSVSKLQIRKNGKSVLEYDRGSWSGDKQYRNLAYKIANKYDRNVRREPEEAKAYAKWINSGDAKDAAYWEDPKNLSPRDLLREVNEAQVKVQRIKDKGSKEYKDAKAWLDKIMAEIVRRNRTHEAAGGKV